MEPSNKKDELISMEEGRSNIIVNLQQTTSCQTDSRQQSNKMFQCASLEKKLQSLKDAISEDVKENDKPKVGKRPKIQKASYMLPGDEKMNKYFEPRMVSIGPLHHGDKFELAEKLKLKLAALFIKKHNLVEVDLYKKINGQIDSLRKCYIEEDIKKVNDEDLAWMFLVDGCALIHYIDCALNNNLRDLNIKMDMEAFAKQDLFLLENQLPYQLLLHVLITSIACHRDQDNVRVSISKFVEEIARKIRGHQSSSSSQPPLHNPPPAHLLELLWRHLVGCNSSSQHLESDNRSSSSCARDNKSSQNPKPTNLYTFRNVNELKAAWIKFKSNTSGSLMNITFESYWFTGTLRLPSLCVDDSTEPMFLNLIAFEMCPDFENDFQVSSYISFLDSLIDQQDDVKDLRKAHILYNALGSDEKVASLFNEIATDIVPNPRTYDKVREDVHPKPL